MTSIVFGSGRASESRTLSCVRRADPSQRKCFMSRPGGTRHVVSLAKSWYRNSVDVFVLI